MDGLDLVPLKKLPWSMQLLLAILREDSAFASILGASKSTVPDEFATDSEATIRRQSMSDQDWDEFLALLVHHRLESHIRQSHLWQQWLAVLPQHIAEKISAQHRRNTFASMRYQSALRTVFSQFAEHNISALLVKGVGVQNWLYKGKIRPSRDIDILVDASSVPAAAKLLRDLGFEQLYCAKPFLNNDQLTASRIKWFKDQSFYHPEMQVVIELHWRLTKVEQAFACEFVELWNQRCTVKVAGSSIPSLPTDIHCAFLCWHSAQAIYGRLFSLRDIAILVSEQADVIEQALLVARKLRIEKAIGCAIVLACWVYAESLPNALLNRPSLLTDSRRLLQGVLPEVLSPTPRRPRGPRIPTTFGHTYPIIAWHSRISGLRFFRLRATMDTISPKYTDIEFVSFPSRLCWLYWLVRPVRFLLVRIASALRALSLRQEAH